MAKGRVVRLGLALTMLLAVGGTVSCQTAFVGDAQFPGGALGCFKQCQKIGMEMGSYVYVGEYSTACACKPKVAAGSVAAAQSSDGDQGAVVAAGAGVMMQMRRAAEQQQQQQLVMAPH